MTRQALESAFDAAWRWAKSRGVEGVDPYDALCSPYLATLHRALGRGFGIAATQFVRRCPLNLRPLLRIGPKANAKGLALFLSAATRTGRNDELDELRRRLMEMRAPGWDLPCWGYPFPWRSRAFYLPEGTPTVVTTTFVANAFLDLYRVSGNERDLAVARDACRFVLEKLHRTEDSTGACLSYSPIDRSAVYNASVLGAQLLVRTGRLTRSPYFVEQAEPLVRYVLARQRSDGAWGYGEARFHAWIDSFHTGFVLSALHEYWSVTVDAASARAIERGIDFYKKSFFGPDGEPYYYSNQRFPFDVHSASQALITLSDLRAADDSLTSLAQRVASFLVRRFLAADGHFRYQIRRTHTVSIPYMRWSQAWGARGLAAMLESTRS